ncbi:MAG: hypothetical protein KC912_18190 [Proteobacteria bacterium]|nr:hypothetical protein [Pseudomonadota bacterium]
MVAELDVLIEQLEELLGEGAFDSDDALEVAAVAGLVARIGTDHEVLEQAVAWRDGPGQELISDGFDRLEVTDIIEALEAVLRPDAEEEVVEEALYEVDELIASAVWCGRRDAVAGVAAEVERLIRQVPEPFAQVADLGVSMARQPAVGLEYELYAFWMAVADAAPH